MMGNNTDDIIGDIINDITMSLVTSDPLITNVTYKLQDLSTQNVTMTTGMELTISEKAAIIFTPSGIISYIFCFIGIIANLLSIIATVNIPLEQTSHFKLIINLALSDSLVIVSIVFHDCMYIFASWNQCIIIIKEFLLHTSLIMTLINLLAMAMNHYLAIIHCMRYRQLMSNFRCNCLIIAIWLISILVGLSDVFAALLEGNIEGLTICEVVKLDSYDMSQAIICVSFLVLIASVTVYMRIYCLVKHMNLRYTIAHNNEVHNSKTLITTLLLIITFAICWLPYGIFQSTVYILKDSNRQFLIDNFETLININTIFFIFLQLNTICDPLIYAVRLKSVQLGYKEVYYKLFCRHQYAANEVGFRNVRATFVSLRRETRPCLIHDNGSIRENEISINLEENMLQQFEESVKYSFEATNSNSDQ